MYVYGVYAPLFCVYLRGWCLLVYLCLQPDCTNQDLTNQENPLNPMSFPLGACQTPLNSAAPYGIQMLPLNLVGVALDTTPLCIADMPEGHGGMKGWYFYQISWIFVETSIWTHNSLGIP